VIARVGRSGSEPGTRPGCCPSVVEPSASSNGGYVRYSSTWPVSMQWTWLYARDLGARVPPSDGPSWLQWQPDGNHDGCETASFAASLAVTASECVVLTRHNSCVTCKAGIF
jgi:hypothetical protein